MLLLALMGQTRADAILFPYVVKSASVTTILSVINTADSQSVPSGELYRADNHIHIRFIGKAGASATDPEAMCEGYNFTVPSSRHDIVSFDVSGRFGDPHGVLFGDVTDYGRDLAGLRGDAPARAFVLVDNNNAVNPPAGVGPGYESTLFGEALVLEFVNGAAWGYRALNKPSVGHEPLAGGTLLDFRPDDWFMDEAAATPVSGVAAGIPVLGFNAAANRRGLARATVLPWAEFETVFFVTPTAANQYQGGLNVRVRPNLSGYANDGGAALIDRDESPISGASSVDVVCVGAVGLTELFSGFVVNTPSLAGQGGWTNIEVRTGGLSGSGIVATPHAAVIKLEYGLEALFAGEFVGGVVNNGFLMTVDQIVLP
ncbi:MAG: hypothetical protein PHQ14_13780 [Chromatiales bacterium]|nr:hypothetical protein [Chromatiales bacterium]